MVINLSALGKENQSLNSLAPKLKTSAFLDKVKQGSRFNQSRNDVDRPQTQTTMSAARVSLKP